MAKIIFVLFQILIPILLLNMLIAMMGNTYAIVIEKSEKEFLKQVLLSIFAPTKTTERNDFRIYSALGRFDKLFFKVHQLWRAWLQDWKH